MIREIPTEIEEFRDAHWRREGVRALETAADAESFVDQVGFAACLTDSRRPGPSLYVAVCGRRDVAVREIARAFLAGAGMTFPGELARVTGLPRAEAGLGNRALVAEGVATMPSRGTYVLVR